MKSIIFLSLFLLGSVAHAEVGAITESEIEETVTSPATQMIEHEQQADEPSEEKPVTLVVTDDETRKPPSAFSNWWESAKSNVSQTWDSDQYELYVPLRVWHNRNTYTKEKIDSFNEQPWGIGLGKYRFDDKGNWHAIFAMAFQDSHNDTEPIIGYAWQATYYPTKHLRTGIGFVAGITARSDMSYVPIPAPLPLVSVEYHKFSLQATYIPGGTGNGNVAFAWLRYQLN